MAYPPDHVTRVYRIVSPQYPPFNGTGTHRWGSRWMSAGQYVVHAAESYALAVLENLVHWQTSAIPRSLLYVSADIPDDIEQEELDRSELPKKSAGDYAAFREIGDDWYQRGETAILWVPSLVSPVESNVLINQTHADFATFVINKPEQARIDPRLQ